jgi:hypothetical protein
MIFGQSQAILAQPDQEPVEVEGVQVQTRGPVHEGFGKPVTFDAQPGLVVPREPPDPIEEVPPEQKPEGENVAWVPGYWSWDDDRKDFIWISGIWRVLPPGRQWVPGYWNKVDAGYQWVSGFWGRANQQKIEYLPTPPETLEIGPSSEPPSSDHIWAPGCWVWYETRYVWRPGYWMAAQPGWIWQPAHYAWTPSGCVFVDSYWDYSVRRRGLLFAPVYVDPVVYHRPAFVYTPQVVVDVDVVTDHFFCRPRYNHYYFGDYYARDYVSIGIQPWFSFHFSRGCYDPIYSYYGWHHRKHNRHWDDDVRNDYHHRREHAHARPARTFAAQQNNLQKNVNNVNVTNVNVNRNINNVDRQRLARPLREVAARKDAPIRLERVEQERRREIAERSREVRKVASERVRAENEVAARRPARDAKAARPVSVALPQSPVVSRPVKELDKARVPPPTPRSPRPDLTATARPRGGDRPAATDAGKPRPVRPDTAATTESRTRPATKPELARPKPEPARGEARSLPPTKPEPARPRAEAAKPHPALKPEPPRSRPDPRQSEIERRVEPRPGPTRVEERLRPEPRREAPPPRPAPRRTESQPRREAPPSRPEPRREAPRPRSEGPPQVDARSRPQPRVEAPLPRPEPRRVEPRAVVPRSQPEPRRAAPRVAVPPPRAALRQAPPRLAQTRPAPSREIPRVQTRSQPPARARVRAASERGSDRRNRGR